MTKQPDPSRSSQLRHGSVPPLGPSDPSSPVVPKLATVTPKPTRRGTTSAADAQAPTAHKDNPKQDRPSILPTSIGAQAPAPVDVDLIRQSTLGETLDEAPLTISDTIQRNRHPVSSVLVSCIVHLIIFLALAFLALGLEKPNPQISVIATVDSTPIAEKPVVPDTETVKIELPVENVSPIEMKFDESSIADNVNAAESEAVSPNVVNNESQPVPSEKIEVVAKSNLPTGGGLEGRESSSRARLASQRGGSRASELAVELGLKWIVAHQRRDGSWRFRHDDGQCDGECGNEGTQEATTAATGLALMALLGAGYTHQVGPYQTEVRNGLSYLVKKIRISPRGGSLVSGSKGMYAHAIATIALSEALTMTNDTGLVGPVQEARKYIQTAQHKAGGWRYDPGEMGDMTVTGWQLMALKSCEMSGFPTGAVTYELAEDFIDSLSSTSGAYGYQEPGENMTTTAIGVLSKMYLGAALQPGGLEQGARMIADHGPSDHDVYFNYYATQVLHHRHDQGWAKWNQKMRDHLINSQDQSSTHRSGSWYFTDPHGQVGGRLYTTAMSVMILEVYYRYLPLYDDDVLKPVN